MQPCDLAAQQSADIIRGRVTGPDSTPVARVRAAAVSYVGASKRESAPTATGDSPKKVYPNGEGNYRMVFNAIRYVQRRIELRRCGDEDVVIADMRVSKTRELQTVNVSENVARAEIRMRATRSRVAFRGMPDRGRVSTATTLLRPMLLASTPSLRACAHLNARARKCLVRVNGVR